jgi:hypothetical protein
MNRNALLAALSTAVLSGTALVASAQVQYPAYPANPPPAAPSSWSYDPYTSGLGPLHQLVTLGSGAAISRLRPLVSPPTGRPHTLISRQIIRLPRRREVVCQVLQ